MTKTKKTIELEQQLGELTLDLQRTRADFENYRKRVEAEKVMARESGRSNAILKLLPVIDNIERAIIHMPNDLADNKWALGIMGLSKTLEKSLESMGLTRIEASPGIAFDPSLHDAVQFDDESEGELEVIAEELQPGYYLDGSPIRHAMVKVTRQ
ncbi:nucleotide exchange factor GrpE [Candidatus Saccharibacteria bacterium]|nr:nucleotide exchange factor GrpE [Candidatus Saccharibacteria bacterium]